MYLLGSPCWVISPHNIVFCLFLQVGFSIDSYTIILQCMEFVHDSARPGQSQKRGNPSRSPTWVAGCSLTHDAGTPDSKDLHF